MKSLIRSVVVLAGCLSSSLAFAKGHGAAPVSGPTYYAPAQPVYVATVHGAAPIDDDCYGVTDPAYFHGWKRDAWMDFERDAAMRARNEDAFLANERFNYAQRWGWNPTQMAYFDRHQADERAQFEQQESARRAAFIEQLAWAKHKHGHGHEHEHEWAYNR